jgi:putative colanic acid biosynthesis UDP-glucose lipid carrier transferase
LANRYSKFTQTIYLTGDLLLVNLSFAVSYYLKFSDISVHNQPYYVILSLYFNIVWVAATFFLKTYYIERVEENTSIIKNILRILFMHALLVAAFIVVREGYYYSRTQLLTTYAFLTITVITWRLLCIYFFRFYRASGYNRRKVVIVGLNDTGLRMKDFFNNKSQYGYLFCGFFDDKANHTDVKGKFSDIQQYVIENEIDEIYCTMSYLKGEQLDELFRFAESYLVRIRIIPNFREIANRNYKIDFYDAYPVLSFHPIPLDDVLNIFTKRVFDIVFSLLVITLFLSWLFPIVAILIKATSKGPVFFKQKRSGKDIETFWCWKFRTMYVSNKNAHFKLATKNDSRITPIGAFLRKTSIDELPQFINILLGEMTVVGPRPHAVEVDSMFATTVNRYKLRHLVKPGLTGLAQIKGFRGNDDDLMRNRIKMDLFYIENWSLVLDIKIIILTLFSMINGDKNAF